MLQLSTARCLALAKNLCFSKSLISHPEANWTRLTTHRFIHFTWVAHSKQGSSSSSSSQCGQNFSPECEAAINKQINMELSASYAYMALAAHFDRHDVALPGFAVFFQKSADEEKEHAEKLMKFQNQRGGRVQLFSIDVPQKTEVKSGLEALEVALSLEKAVNKALLDVHRLADQHKDPQTTDFLESEFLEEQIVAIKKLTDYITQLRRCGPGKGEYLFDTFTLQPKMHQ